MPLLPRRHGKMLFILLIIAPVLDIMATSYTQYNFFLIKLTTVLLFYKMKQNQSCELIIYCFIKIMHKLNNL